LGFELLPVPKWINPEKLTYLFIFRGFFMLIIRINLCLNSMLQIEHKSRNITKSDENTVLYNVRTKVFKYKTIEYHGDSRNILLLSALVYNLYLPSEVCHDCRSLKKVKL